ncbi:MMPL family transporter [Streptomyces monticola]|uniref:MMPL family transporter n=1 Tax=Streptomyces monticola TaxID=2666263 RepID=A0ABW2JSN8_9ACTN
MRHGGTSAPGVEAAHADAELTARFGAGVPNLVLLARARNTPGGAPGHAVDTPAVRAAGQRLTARLAAAPEVVSVRSYWGRAPTPGEPTLRSRDGRAALVVAKLTGEESDWRHAAARIVPRLDGPQGALTVTATGPAQIGVEIDRHSEDDLLRAELLAALPMLLVLLAVLRTVVAGLLPLALAALSVLATFAGLRVLSLLTPVSVYAVNMATALTLALSVDYSLFVLSRYREEVRTGLDRAAALRTATATAGRTVLYSAVALSVSLSALLLFPQYFLRSFAYAGICVTVVSAAGATLVLPAMLAVLGERVEAWPVRIPQRRKRAPSSGKRAPSSAKQTAFWPRLARAVARRPAGIAVAVTALLLLLAAPFARAQFGLLDDRVLPPSAAAHRAADQLRTQFAPQAPVVAVLPRLQPDATSGSLSTYADRIEALPHVRAVDVHRADGGAWLAVRSAVEPYSGAGSDLVRQVRAVPAPGERLVGGPAAQLVDTRDDLAARAPWALAVIAAATLVVLFLFTGSLLLPLKGLAVNLLSLTASFGAMVHIFQDGHLRGLVGDFTVTGYLDTAIPVLVFCIGFGLSMDYEVFLLSRVREQYLRHRDNTAAVADGLQVCGRLITSAAAILIVVFVAFATSQVSLVKLFGIGLALAIALDATIVRGLLVPAVMVLAGRANWWAPGPLRRLHRRFGLRETPAGTQDPGPDSDSDLGPDSDSDPSMPPQPRPPEPNPRQQERDYS